MIKHIVFWKIKATDKKSKEEVMKETKEKLESMEGKVPQIRAIEVGINYNPADIAYDLALYTEFDSKEDLLNYQKDKYHHKIKEYLVNVQEASCVVDYEI